MLRLIKNVDSDRLTVVVVVISIIFVLLSVLTSIVFIIVLQDIIYFSRSHWFFNAPVTAYLTFGAGMLWIPFVLIAYLITRLWKEKKGKELKHSWIFSVLLLVSIPICASGTANYYYMDDAGVYYNQLFSYSETSYKWEDITEARRMMQKGGGTRSITEYVFVTSSGDSVSIPYDQDVAKYSRVIRQILEENGVQIEDIEVAPE
ncbi:hypothetical protein SAMN05421736_10754 [Evansella caseinilytica]|uniref:Uncharacterized protein n=1 Tax=Evansella caseinilytica TaxID=1503961 RepID=A0A1H3QU66_9BACI|nr:hypothetical protein [Evansella caseinilytica]SDZ16967.1 hypothetical protein SAMN05421736_10754 [Evansella caseinilytica]